MLAQFTTWDTENDAREFFEAYANRTEKRYNPGKQLESSPQLRVVETGEGLASIELRGKDVVMIEGAASREQLAKTSERVWQSKKGIVSSRK